MTARVPPPAGGSTTGVNGFDRYVRIGLVHICGDWPSDLGIDSAWCDEIEPGIRANGQLEPVGITPCAHGWAVVFKYHLYTVLARIHEKDPTFVMWGRVRTYFSKEDHLLDEWIENHHRKIDPEVLKEKFILPLLKAGNNQSRAADKLGIQRSYVTMLLHPEKYGDRPHEANGVHPVNTNERNGTSVGPVSAETGSSPSLQLTSPPTGSHPRPTMPEPTRIGSGLLPSQAPHDTAGDHAIVGPSRLSREQLAPPSHTVGVALAAQGAFSSPLRVVPSYEKAVLEAQERLGALRASLSPRKYAGATNAALTPLAQEMEAVAWTLLDTAADLRALRFPLTPTPREHIPVVVRVPENGGGTRAAAREVRAKRAVPVVREVP